MSLSSAGRLTINLNAIRANYDTLKDRVGPACTVAAVAKADGYGLGAGTVSNALYDAGCRHFFVSSPAEGAALRAHVGQSAIYILNGFYARQSAAYVEHKLTPVLGSFIEVETYTELARAQNKRLPAVLNFNIRMNRLGFGHVETDKLCRDLDMLSGLHIDMVMSHFACADEPDHPMTAEQHRVFCDIARHFPKARKSIANSSGIFRDKAYHFDLVRPGMALYGLNPTPESASPMMPVIALSVPVIRLRRVNKGGAIGYGATYRFDQDTWTATISAGYADGLFRNLSNTGRFYWKGQPCPIRGRISMDLISVDLSAIPRHEHPRPGDFLDVLGPDQTADDLASQSGTIGYEVLTALGHRYNRTYIDDHKPTALKRVLPTQR